MYKKHIIWVLITIILVQFCFLVCTPKDSKEIASHQDLVSLNKRLSNLEESSSNVYLVKESSIDWYKLSSTVATFFAVCVSLWLAYRERLARFMVEAVFEPKTESVTLVVTNIGSRDVVIKQVCIYPPSLRLFNKKPIHFFEESKELEDSRYFNIEIPKESNGIPECCREMKGITKFLYGVKILHFHATVTTSTKKKVTIRVRKIDCKPNN
ncbi:hypothetical protein [Sessilibacter sp. MAH4]